MQIQPPTVAAPVQTRPVEAREPAAVDFQSFLRLLTAQLRNQDPLSPLDSTQFVAQLASFSTVEQLVSANARLDEIGADVSGGGIADYAGWIGRTAEVAGLPAPYEGAPIPVRFDTRPGAIRTEVIVRTGSGEEIARLQAPPGGGEVIWDGAGARQGERYAFEATYAFEDGSSAVSPAATLSAINGVRETSDGVLLELDNGFVVTAAQVRGLSR